MDCTGKCPLSVPRASSLYAETNIGSFNLAKSNSNAHGGMQKNFLLLYPQRLKCARDMHRGSDRET